MIGTTVAIFLLITLIVKSLHVRKISPVKSNFNVVRRTCLFAVDEISSAEELDVAVKSAADALVVVDYSTTWCGPCKLVLPKYIALSEKYPNVKFYKCIGDATPAASLLMKREGIRSVPAFHFWKNGEKIDTVGGARIEDVESLVVKSQ